MNEQGSEEVAGLKIPFVPTPTREYQAHREELQSRRFPAFPGPRPIPLPRPAQVGGARVLIWKQDPTVSELGVRRAYLPARVFTGPRDARISLKGIAPVAPNSLGDFIQTPGTDPFDAVHTFAVVRQTLTLVQRAMDGDAVPWQWNSSSNTDPLEVHPHGIPDTMNAFYSRNNQALKFGDFIRSGSSPQERIFTCRSLDIVAHEAGHAILDSLRPQWLLLGNPPQTGGLHESFGDLTAIFMALSQLDQVEALIALTKGDLHEKSFLEDVAEEFGRALGRPNGLRNADNDLKLSQVSNEVHAISQVFTGAMYDIMADLFDHERNPGLRDDAEVLYEVGRYMWRLVLRALKAESVPTSGAVYADVANAMLQITSDDGKPVEYRNAIRNRFALREIVTTPPSFALDIAEGAALERWMHESDEAAQDRSNCCGTMNLTEYTEEGGEEQALQAEIEGFRAAL